jgi:hypothetical protein
MIDFHLFKYIAVDFSLAFERALVLTKEQKRVL